MGLFRRGKKDAEQQGGVDETVESVEEVTGDDRGDELAAAPRRLDGPLDASDIEDKDAWIDFGSLLIRGREGLQVGLQVEEATQAIQGLTLATEESVVELHPYAAPRTFGVWTEIRHEIAANVTTGGGTSEVVSGPFGQELHARLVQDDGRGGSFEVPVRFIGVDGPRWFLRAMVTGKAAVEPGQGQESQAIEDVIAGIAVARGEAPMAPREALPLRLPEDAQAVPPQQDDESSRRDDLNPFERGPEITEVH